MLYYYEVFIYFLSLGEKIREFVIYYFSLASSFLEVQELLRLWFNTTNKGLTSIMNFGNTLAFQNILPELNHAVFCCT